MARRTPRQKRFLGLWTAAWLAALLLAGLLVAGDIRVQWPVFAVPLVWALVAVRPRRGGNGRAVEDDDLDDVPGFWDDPPAHRPAATRPPHRPPPRPPSGPSSSRPTAPPTREAGVLPPLPPRAGEPYPEDRGRGSARG